MPDFKKLFSGTYSDATSMVLELACPSPMGAMVRGTGFFLGAISIMTLGYFLKKRTDLQSAGILLIKDFKVVETLTERATGPVLSG